MSIIPELWIKMNFMKSWWYYVAISLQEYSCIVRITVYYMYIWCVSRLTVYYG
jgi:hypothetical protein